MILPKMYNNFYYIINKKTSLVIIAWLITLIIFLIIFLIIAFNYKYNIYKTYLGYIKQIDDDFYSLIYVEKDEIGFLSNYKLLIDNQNIEFEITAISKEYYVIDNNLCYEVTIKAKLQEKYLIENNILNFVFDTGQTTIYQNLRKELKQWLN